MRSPHMTSYTGFGPHGLAAGQFGAIGRGRLVLIEKRRPLAMTDASPELALEREWGWI